MTDLECFIEILTVGGQANGRVKDSDKIDGQSIYSSGRDIIEGMLEETFLFDLFDESGVHIEVHGVVVFWEIVVVVTEDLSLYGDWIQDEAQVRVALEVTKVSNKQSPSCLPTEFVIRKNYFFKGRIESKYDVFFKGFS